MFSPKLILPMFLLFLTVHLPAMTRSQNFGNSPSGPTIGQCGPVLLPLTSCAPFVQGRAPLPVQQCCDNLNRLYIQQPRCLCLLLNGTTFTSLPINITLAQQLPLICSLRADSTLCSGLPVTLPSTPPTPLVSFGTNNSTVTASPTVTPTPRPNVMGYGYLGSAGIKFQPKCTLMVVTLIVAGAAHVNNIIS